MVRVYRCTVSQGENASSRLPSDMYRLPGWLSDRDVSRARASEHFREDDSPEAYRPFIELRWVGEDLHVEAGYHTRLTPLRSRHLSSLDQRQECVQRVGDERMPRFLDYVARAFEEEVLLSGYSLRGDWRRGDYGGFILIPPRDEHDYDLRAVAELQREYLRKPIMRALEDVINHEHSRFAGPVEVRVEYEPHRKS